MNARILVVEDELHIANTLSRILRAAFDPQTSIVVCGVAETALARLNAEPFDLLITDWHLPGLSGLALAARARRLFPNLKIVFMTASPVPEIEERMKGVADLCITKPYQPSALVEQMKGLY